MKLNTLKNYLLFLLISYLGFNGHLFELIWNDYADLNFLFGLWIVVFFFLTHVIFISLFNLLVPTKWLVYVTIVFAGFMSYFSSRYAVIFDVEMWRNIFQTNPGEAGDLVNASILIYFLTFAITPIALISYLKVDFSGSFKERVLTRLMIIASAIITILIMFFVLSRPMTDFLREHKQLRYYNNPSYGIFNLFKFSYESVFVNRKFDPGHYHTKVEEYHSPHEPIHREELIVLVIGETARYDHFGINGYKRQTTPNLLAIENLISYSNFTACGTSTAVSVPCIFSLKKDKDYRVSKAPFEANILDIMPADEVNIHWLDNNSDSKHVADRVDYKNFKTSDLNPICDPECRDVGMIPEIKKIIKPDMDNLIVLHQMGSHGPAYFKRYPVEFEKFTPTCQSENISLCSNEEIINAYDNTILYTDYFLSQLIKELSTLTDTYEVTMVYVSDHGESLGENGVYLHGLPKAIAPKSQIHVPVFLWAPVGSSDVDFHQTLKLKDNEFTHSHISDLLLKLAEIQSDAYKLNEQPMIIMGD